MTSQYSGPSPEQMRQLAAAGYGYLTEETHAIATETFLFVGLDELYAMTDEERERYGLTELYEYARQQGL